MNAMNINDARDQPRPHTSHGHRRPEEPNTQRTPMGRRPSAGAHQGRGPSQEPYQQGQRPFQDQYGQGRGYPPEQYPHGYRNDQRPEQGPPPGRSNAPPNGPPIAPSEGRPRGLSRSNTMPDVGAPFTGPPQQNLQQPRNQGQFSPPPTRNFLDARPATAEGARTQEKPDVQRSGSDDRSKNRQRYLENPPSSQRQPIAQGTEPPTREMPNFDAMNNARPHEDHIQSPITGSKDRQQYQPYQKPTYQPPSAQSPPPQPPPQGLPTLSQSSPPPDPALGQFSFGLPSGPAPKRKQTNPTPAAPAPVQIPQGDNGSSRFDQQPLSPRSSQGSQQYPQQGSNAPRGMESRPDIQRGTPTPVRIPPGGNDSSRYGQQPMSPRGSQGSQQYSQQGPNVPRGMESRPENQRLPPNKSQYPPNLQSDARRGQNGTTVQQFPPRTASRSANRAQNGPSPVVNSQPPYSQFDQGYGQTYQDPYNQGYAGYGDGYGNSYGQGYQDPYNPQPGQNLPPGPPQPYGTQQSFGPGQPIPSNMVSQATSPAPSRPLDGQIGPPVGPGMSSRPPPIRPGLISDNEIPSIPNKPTPVRQYEPSPQGQVQSQASRSSLDNNIPVSAYDLNLMQQAIRSNPEDHKTGLTYAKKLVEAASVLANEGGNADAKATQKNREKYIFDAHKQIKKLVNAGYPEAMFYLADCYGSGGLGLQIDPQEAFKLYQSAAKLGHAQAAYRVAVCCEMGNEEGGGTKRDPPRAVTWYKRAAAMGDTPAMYKTAMILLKGLLGQPPNRRDAVTWLKRAAERATAENPHALHELGLLYEAAGGNDVVVRDVAHARELFEQAARLGYKFSQFRLASAYEYGHLDCPVDPRQSIKWYSKAAAQGEHQSELALSGWYLTGSEGILQQSDTEAYLWARKAAQSGLAKAEYAMGYFTEVGIGVTANLDEAKKWYWRASGKPILVLVLMRY